MYHNIIVANRTRTEIIAQILEIAKDATQKTRIMYGAYMSYSQAQEYLSILIGQGLIRHIREENKYKTTKKGMEFLKAVEKVNEIRSIAYGDGSQSKEMLKN